MRKLIAALVVGGLWLALLPPAQAHERGYGYYGHSGGSRHHRGYDSGRYYSSRHRGYGSSYYRPRSGYGYQPNVRYQPYYQPHYYGRHTYPSYRSYGYRAVPYHSAPPPRYCY